MKRLAVVCILILASGFIAYRIGSREQEIASSPSVVVVNGLAIEESLLDLGDVWEEEDLTRSVTITNRTDKDIPISAFAVSCGCVRMTPGKLTIPAGQSANVELQLDLMHRSPSDVGLNRRPFAYEITPLQEVKGASRGGGWKVHGVVQSRVILDTTCIDFADAIACGEMAQPQRILVKVFVPAARLGHIRDGLPFDWQQPIHSGPHAAVHSRMHL